MRRLRECAAWQLKHFLPPSVIEPPVARVLERLPVRAAITAITARPPGQGVFVFNVLKIVDHEGCTVVELPVQRIGSAAVPPDHLLLLLHDLVWLSLLGTFSVVGGCAEGRKRQIAQILLHFGMQDRWIAAHTKAAAVETTLRNSSLWLLEGGADHWHCLSRRCRRTRASGAVNVFFPR
jgi:hypothetical protein